MGRASSAKELRRRQEQGEAAPHHRTGARQDNRERRREQERAGEVLLFDPREAFKLEFKLHVPPGVLRDDHPSMIAGSLVADNESDILRGIFVKIATACGYTRPEFGRAVTGMFAEVINPMNMKLRSEIAVQIAQGTGLDVQVQEMTSCAFCGAEQEMVSMMTPIPGDFEGTDEGDKELVEEDQTVHHPQCPTQTRPDVDAIAEAGDDTPDPLPTILGRAVEWKTGPALVILHPYKYQPLITAPAAPTVEGAEAAAVEMDADMDKPLQFPSPTAEDEV